MKAMYRQPVDFLLKVNLALAKKENVTDAKKAIRLA